MQFNLFSDTRSIGVDFRPDWMPPGETPWPESLSDRGIARLRLGLRDGSRVFGPQHLALLGPPHRDIVVTVLAALPRWARTHDFGATYAPLAGGSSWPGVVDALAAALGVDAPAET